jgi:hypothetical protein
MRIDTNQGELALDAPDNVITLCRSEAHAVQICLTLAMHRMGRDQRTVAAMCGWKSDSCLSEIASEANKRRMPDNRRERFALATSCNLLNQYAARQEMLRLAAGKTTERDRTEYAAAACMAAWRQAA